MSSSHDTHHNHRWERSVSADPSAVGSLRGWLSSWLREHVVVDDERHADVLLAVYEALSNCADHAYVGYDESGTVSLRVGHDAVAYTLIICVIDHGGWVVPSVLANPARGRGIYLMHALAEEVTVDGRPDGTTVCLRFEQCPPCPTAAATE